MADEAEPGAARDDAAIREAIQQEFAEVRRQIAELVAAQAQIVAATHRRDLRRWALDAAAPAAVTFVLLTAFGLANAGAVYGLASVMPSWAAALVLAGAWVAVGAALTVAIWIRAERGDGLRWWRVFAPQSDNGLAQARAARERAEQRLRESLERLAPDLAKEATTAAVPIASAVATEVATGMATGVATEVAGGVVETGGDLLEASGEIVESITEDVPGGGIVNQIWDVVLLPGRVGVRVVTTVLRRPPRSGGDGG
jgi:hypothetical protein